MRYSSSGMLFDGRQDTAVPVCFGGPGYGSDIAFDLPVARKIPMAAPNHLIELVARCERAGVTGEGIQELLNQCMITRQLELQLDLLDRSSEGDSSSGSGTSLSRSSRRRRARKQKMQQFTCAKIAKSELPGYSYMNLLHDKTAMRDAELLGPYPSLTTLFSLSADAFSPDFWSGEVLQVVKIGHSKWVFGIRDGGVTLARELAAAVAAISPSLVSPTVAAKVSGMKPFESYPVYVVDVFGEMAHSVAAVELAECPGLCYLKAFPIARRLDVYLKLNVYPTLPKILLESDCDASVQIEHQGENVWHVVDEGSDITLATLSTFDDSDCQVVGALRTECVLLGHQNRFSDMCDACQGDVDDNQVSFCGTPECSVDATRLALDTGNVTFCMVRSVEFGHVPYSAPIRIGLNDSGCRQFEVSDYIRALAPATLLYFSSETYLRFGTGVIVHSPDPVVVLMLAGADVVVDGAGSGKCVGIEVGTRVDKIRWMHKYLGEDLTNDFCHLWFNSSAGVAILPSRRLDSMSMHSAPFDRAEASNDEYAGTRKATIRSGAYYDATSYGTILFVEEGVWSATFAAPAQSAAITMGVGSAVAFPHRLRGFVCDAKLNVGTANLVAVQAISRFENLKS